MFNERVRDPFISEFFSVLLSVWQYPTLSSTYEMNTLRRKGQFIKQLSFVLELTLGIYWQVNTAVHHQRGFVQRKKIGILILIFATEQIILRNKIMIKKKCLDKVAGTVHKLAWIRRCPTWPYKFGSLSQPYMSLHHLYTMI